MAILKILAWFYNCFWYVCPFVLVFGLAHGIRQTVQTGKLLNPGLIAASVSLLLMLSWSMYLSMF